MPAIRQDNQFVSDTMTFQFLRHKDGLLIGNVRILIAMKQQCWRVPLCHIADWAEWIKRLGFLIWVMSGHFLWPQALLSAVKIKTASLGALTLRNHGAADYLVGFVLWHGRLLAIKRIRSAVPIANNVTITVERHQSLGTRIQAEPGH